MPVDSPPSPAASTTPPVDSTTTPADEEAAALPMPDASSTPAGEENSASPQPPASSSTDPESPKPPPASLPEEPLPKPEMLLPPRLELTESGTGAFNLNQYKKNVQRIQIFVQECLEREVYASQDACVLARQDLAVILEILQDQSDRLENSLSGLTNQCLMFQDRILETFKKLEVYVNFQADESKDIKNYLKQLNFYSKTALPFILPENMAVSYSFDANGHSDSMEAAARELAVSFRETTLKMTNITSSDETFASADSTKQGFDALIRACKDASSILDKIAMLINTILDFFEKMDTHVLEIIKLLESEAAAYNDLLHEFRDVSNSLNLLLMLWK